MDRDPDSADSSNQGALSRHPFSDRWYFTKDQLTQTPSLLSKISAEKELEYRYQCAELMQNIGQKLGLLQIAINTAILYMHRFYQFHSFYRFHRNCMAPVFIFLAAKVEEQPRRLEHVVKITYKLLHPQEQMDIQTKPEIYTEKFAEEGELMVTHENVLLQTLAFDIRVEHPHTHVIRCCQIIRCEKEVSHAAYALASCALHFTKVCIQYRPILVACMCIDVSSKWSNTHIPLSKENLPWYHYMDPSVTLAEIQQVSADFLDQVNKYPDKIRQKIRSQVMGQGGSFSLEAAGGPVAKPEPSLSSASLMQTGPAPPPKNSGPVMKAPPGPPNPSSGRVPPGNPHPPVARPPSLPKAAPPPVPAGHPPPPPPPPDNGRSYSSGVGKPREPRQEDIRRSSGAPQRSDDLKRSREGELLSSSRYAGGNGNAYRVGESQHMENGNSADGSFAAVKRRKIEPETGVVPERAMHV